MLPYNIENRWLFVERGRFSIDLCTTKSFAGRFRANRFGLAWINQSVRNGGRIERNFRYLLLPVREVRIGSIGSDSHFYRDDRKICFMHKTCLYSLR